MTNYLAGSALRLRVLLADSKPLENQLLAQSLHDRGFDVWPCECEVSSILELLDRVHVDVAVLSCAALETGETDVMPMRTLHLTHPGIPKILLIENGGREVTVQGFRAGARGLFNIRECSFSLFCECLERVNRGEIFASTEQLNYLLDSVCQVPALRVLSSGGDMLLTSREEQVVALVADGLSNREVAGELGLSEHTVKKYLFKIFEKLGISSRVELVLYAMHNGQHPFESTRGGLSVGSA